MKKLWINDVFNYDGSQLSPLFAYLNFGLLGDSIVSWRGPCQIPWNHMIDGEDLRVQSPIEGSDMVHFIIEKFNCELFSAVGLQRLMASIVMNHIQINIFQNGKKELLIRDGDDIYLKDKKLSISVATLSRTSALIHFAVNISNEGTPVETCSLNDFSIKPVEFAQSIMTDFCNEVTSMVEATQKVKTL